MTVSVLSVGKVVLSRAHRETHSMLDKQGIIILCAIPAVGENPCDGTTMFLRSRTHHLFAHSVLYMELALSLAKPLYLGTSERWMPRAAV